VQLHEPSGRHALGFALAVSTMLLWGVLPHGLELALAELDPVTITWFRFGVSAAAMLAWLGARGALPQPADLGGQRLLLFVATAFLAANYLAYLVGLDLTTPANAQVLIQMAPLLLAVGGIVVFRERFTPGQWMCFAVLISGMALFFASQLRELVAGLDRYLKGVATIAFAAVTWAIYGLAQKQLLRSFTAQQIMTVIYVGCFACFSLGASPGALAELTAVGWASLLFAAANTLLAYGCFAAALEHWPASRVSAVLALSPLTTLVTGLAGSRWLPELVASEQVSGISLAGAALVVMGSMGVSLAGRRGVSVTLDRPPPAGLR
jgi:drug/metabolite transporter (DMT)-like permease